MNLEQKLLETIKLLKELSEMEYNTEDAHTKGIRHRLYSGNGKYGRILIETLNQYKALTAELTAKGKVPQ